jgi:ABC-2 type transport system permease protein
MWLLSGALFQQNGASPWIRAVMSLNPLTYGVGALRWLLYHGHEGTFALKKDMSTLILFSLVMFGLALLMANRRSTKPAA